MESYNIEPFCLTSLTLLNVLKVHLCVGMCQYFTPFLGRILFHCMDITHSVYLFISW